MAGLLDNMGGDALKSLAVGAATGFNPLVGLLAMPMITKGRERRARENDEMRRVEAFREGVTDLAGRTEKVQGPGQSLSLLDPFSNEQEVRRIPGKYQDVPAYQTPQGQQELMGLLSQVDPASAAKMMMPAQGRSDPADARMMQMLGIPMTPEGFQQYMGIKGGPVDPMQMMLGQLMASQRQQDLEIKDAEERRRQQEAEQQAQTREQEKKSTAGILESNVTNLMDLYGINQQLAQMSGVEGILNRPGLPFAEQRRALAAAATPEEAAMVDNMQSLIDQIGLEKLATDSFDGNTNARFDAFMRTKPSLQFLGPANDKNIIRNLKGALLADEAKGYVMDPAIREQVEQFIAQQESGGLNTLEVGDIVEGYRYIGGVRGDPASWEKVQ